MRFLTIHSIQLASKRSNSEPYESHNSDANKIDHMCEIPPKTLVDTLHVMTAFLEPHGRVSVAIRDALLEGESLDAQHPSSALLRCRIRNSPKSMAPVLSRNGIRLADLASL
eukprot:5155239-Amphidinium_carterae.3